MLDGISLRRRQSSLRRHRIADRITLNLQACLDTGRKIESRKGLIDAPEIALQLHCLWPLARLAQIVKMNALTRHDAGGSSHPADSADQHHGGRNMRRSRKNFHARRAV